MPRNARREREKSARGHARLLERNANTNTITRINVIVINMIITSINMIVTNTSTMRNTLTMNIITRDTSIRVGKTLIKNTNMSITKGRVLTSLMILRKI